MRFQDRLEASNPLIPFLKVLQSRVKPLRAVYVLVTSIVLGIMAYAPGIHIFEFLEGEDIIDVGMEHYTWWAFFGILVVLGVLFSLSGRTRRPKGPHFLIAAFALFIASFILSLSTSIILVPFLDLNYPALDPPQWIANVIRGSWKILLIATWSIALFWLRRRIQWKVLALSFSITIALLGWFGILTGLANLPSETGSIAHQLTVFSVLALLWGLGTLLYIIPIEIPHPVVEIETRGLSKTSNDTKTYLSSARQLSTVLLLIIIIAFDVSFTHMGRVRDLQDARRIYATEYVLRTLIGIIDESSLVDAKNEEEWKRGLSNNNRVDEYESSRIGTIYISVEEIKELSREVIFKGIRVTIEGEDRDWSVRVSNRRFREPLDYKAVSVLARLIEILPESDPDQILKIADRWDIAVEEIASEMKLGDYQELYRAIEKKVLAKEVTLPTVAVGVNSLTAMWWLSIVLIGLLILIRNRVRTVLRDSNGASEEPWLILDDSVGLERFLASTWLAAVLLSPWIVGALLLMTVAGQATADGIQQPFITMLPRLLGLVAVPILGGWIGASLVLMLSQLRQMRATIRSSKEKGGDQ